MAIYFTIGIIVSMVEMIMAYRDLNKYGLTVYDVYPTLESYDIAGLMLITVSTHIVLAMIWPVQVGFWVYKFMFKRKVQTDEES